MILTRLPALGLAALVASSSLLLAACGGSDADPNLVTTDKGSVEGSTTAGVRSFKGLPYAAPPVGALRWAAPQPAAAWTNTLAATAFAPHCPQLAGPFGVASTSEDCLYLNVYTPTVEGPYPVMVWIHGGALVTGESDDYDVDQLVAQGLVVVTINYRLGALGFLAHPALSAENASQVSGNYGFLDQQAALRWVKTNIAAFGGDPANVAIAGESAGGYSVLAQVASPLAAGLFSKAIVESGAYALTQSTLAQAQTSGQSFATRAGCTDQSAACLRALSVAAVLQAQTGGSPNVDGKVLTATLASAFASGNFNKVALIDGSNSHEYSLLSAASIDTALGREMNATEYPTNITQTFRTLAPAVLAQYPVTLGPTPTWAYDQALTDTTFSCSGRTAAKSLTANGSTVFTYEFNDANAPMVFALPQRAEGFGAYHASELQYVFPGNQTITQGAPFNANQQALSTQMIRYWAQFVRSGDPNGTGSPSWPAYSAANDTYQSLTPGAIAPTTGFAAAHKCVFWTGS